MSIHIIANKIKGWAGERKEMLIHIGILAFVSCVSFYIGYVARAETHKESQVAIDCPSEAYLNPGLLALNGKSTFSDTKSILSQASIGSESKTSGAYVASKNGKKYYPVDCAGANRIKEENKVFFTTSSEAEAAGYTLGAGCSN